MMLMVWRGYIMMTKSTTIKSYDIRAVLIGGRVAHDFEVVIQKVGTLYVSLICNRVNLVGLFMPHF